MPKNIDNLIQVQNVSLSYQGRQVLSDINFCIRANEIVTLIGPNGAGKSSLVRAMIGAIKVTEGRINRHPDLRFGYVPQSLHADALLPMDVERFLNLPKRASPQILSEVIAQTGIGALLKQGLTELSGGQARRVLLAHALLDQPKLLILDEPTAGLDQAATIQFYQLIERLRDERGIAILLVSHDIHMVMKSSDRVICINVHICCQGAPTEINQEPAYSEFFGSVPFSFYEHHHDHTHDELS